MNDAPDIEKLATIERAINVKGAVNVARPKRPAPLKRLASPTREP